MDPYERSVIAEEKTLTKEQLENKLKALKSFPDHALNIEGCKFRDRSIERVEKLLTEV
jgi:hypothetical protein